MNGLSEQMISQVIGLAERCGVQKLVLFGSRARGDYKPTSDIDLAVYGLERQQEMILRSAIEELPTLLKFDIVPIRKDTDAVLLKEIERDGVVLMEKRITKAAQFENALARMKESVEDCRQIENSTMRDGVIQRFEFTCELAWKACREFLLEEGFVGIDSPKAVMRQAYASGLIDDEQGWIALLQARNLTSHMYSEQQAKEIYEAIVSIYIDLFERLQAKLSE